MIADRAEAQTKRGQSLTDWLEYVVLEVRTGRETLKVGENALGFERAYLARLHGEACTRHMDPLATIYSGEIAMIDVALRRVRGDG